MIQFFIYSCAMLLFALSVLFYDTWRRRDIISDPQAAIDEHARINLDVLRDQSRELDNDFQNGTLDETEFFNSRRELDIRAAYVLNDGQVASDQHLKPGWTVVLVGTGIAVLAALLYAVTGTPSGLDARQVLVSDEAAHVPANPAPTPQQIEDMVKRLAEKLKSSPNDVEGWTMLARSYETLRRFDLAAGVYAHLVKLTPQNANLFDDYAVTLAMSLNQSLTGEPEKLIRQALTIDPNNIQALALSGSAAFERKEYAKAIIPWKRILKLIPPDSSMSHSISENIHKAEVLAKE